MQIKLMLENLVTWNRFTFAVYVALKLFKAPCKRTQHCWATTPNIVKSCCNVDAKLLDVTLVLRPFAHPVACCCKV